MDIIEYDVFVIGSGIAGQTAAQECAAYGLKVAIADDKAFGGTCAIRGCDPKKVMLQFADIHEKIENLKGLGFTKSPKISWEDILSFKNSFTNPVPKATEEDLIEQGISLYHQSPKFIDKNTILVEGKKVKANYFVIATGLIPRPLQIKGSDLLKTSDDFFNLKEIPKSAIFVGGGYIALEFAYLLNALGCKVTIIESGAKILSQFETFLTNQLKEYLAEKGINFIFNADVTSVEKLRKNKRVYYQKDDKKHTLKAVEIFNTTGRVPAVKNLNLENAKIANGENGISVNNYLQSVSNKNTYSCGDVSSKSLPLTPLSGLQGYIVSRNIIKNNSKKFRQKVVPSVVFTHPKLAMVGLTEEQAKQKYTAVKVYKAKVDYWYNAKKENISVYAYKIIVNEKTDVILGAHLLSSEANENINIFSLAIQQKMTTKAFKKLIFTYPSYANDLKKMMANN